MASTLVGRPMDILLVEDSLSDAGLTMQALKNGGVQHRMTLVTTAEEAVEFLSRQGRFARAPRPDLILLDLGLPQKDGRELLREIKVDLDLQTIPVVVMTASDDEGDRLQCGLLDVDGYVTKPVDIEKFLVLVKQLKRFWLDDVIVPGV